MKHIKNANSYTATSLKTSNHPHFSCTLCGKETPSTGVLFKGHCVCEECLDYVATKVVY